MRKLVLIVVSLFFSNILLGQASLTINDTRNINDRPNFSPYTFRLDFKWRDVINVPGINDLSTTMTISPWMDVTGGVVHQLNFNDGGIYYRTGRFNSSGWNNWRKLLVEDSDGNVGIGTSTISNEQGWGKVLDVFNLNHSKLLIRSNTVKTGVFAHEGDQIGLIGTESNHDLRFVVGYWTYAMTIKTNGNVGIGTIDPKTRFDIFEDGSGGSADSNIPNHGMMLGGTGTKGVLNMGINASGIFHSWIQSRSQLSAEYFNLVLNPHGGNVGIGTTDPTAKLTVAGDILAREIRVEANAGADFVFEENYPLKPLKEVEQFITENKHLPDISPADSMVQNGVNMGEFQIRLLQKIEELTLYTIEQQKQIDELRSELKDLKANKEY